MTTIIDIIDQAIEANEQAARYAALAFSNRRRITTALELMDHGKLKDARELLALCLADDGKFLSKRVQRIAEKVYAEYAGNDPQRTP